MRGSPEKGMSEMKLVFAIDMGLIKWVLWGPLKAVKVSHEPVF